MEALGLVGESLGVGGKSVGARKYFLEYRLIAAGDGGALPSRPELTGLLYDKLPYLLGFLYQPREG